MARTVKFERPEKKVKKFKTNKTRLKGKNVSDFEEIIDDEHFKSACRADWTEYDNY